MIRLVPETFQFPLFDTKTMFNLWHYGNTRERIRPYKMLAMKEWKCDLRTIQEKRNVNRAKLIMDRIDTICTEQNLFPNDKGDFSQLTLAEASEVFDTAYIQLIEQLYPGGQTFYKRPNDLSLNTLADREYKRKRSLIVEETKE